MKRQSEGAEQVYAAAEMFVDRCLRQQSSLFTPGKSIWTHVAFDEAIVRFVDRPDVREGKDFEEKFRQQFIDASDVARQFMAECLYVHFLPATSSIGPEQKRNVLQMALSGCAVPVTIPPELDRALSFGLAKPGMAFNTYRFELLSYLIRFAKHWWNLPDSDRAAALSDPWRFKAQATTTFSGAAATQFHLLLHLVHPDTFESIASTDMKQQIVTKLAITGEPTDDIDRTLLAIRSRLASQFGATFNFWDDQVKSLWSTGEKKGQDTQEDPVPPPSRRFWKIAPGEQASHWDACRDGGYICIGWGLLGDLTGIDRATFDARFGSIVKDNSDYTPNGVNQVWKFYSLVKPGDVVVANEGIALVRGVGVVTGTYQFDPDEPDYRHKLPVRWVSTEPIDVPPQKGAWQRTLLELDRDSFESLTHLRADDLTAPLDPPKPPPPPVTDPPPRDTSRAFADLAAHPVASLLLRRLNVILYGPPGTGKTRAALEVSDLWHAAYGAASVHLVTFHPSFAYEDFIEGFRPEKDGTFRLKPGVFRRACHAAHESPGIPHLLLIDEINRGDVARLFGELITLIEPDKRGKHPVTLPYSGDAFCVPSNLHVLGTMNTADKSISILDVALRRRFCFVEFAPDPSVLRDVTDHHRTIDGVDLARLLDALNARLADVGVDPDRAVGHSHLLVRRTSKDPAAELRERFRHDLIPLVEEYCYADRASIAKVFGRLVDRRSGRVVPAVFDDPGAFLSAVREIAAPDGTASSVLPSPDDDDDDTDQVA